MVVINANFPDFFAGAATIFQNAQNNAEIAAALATYGYTADVMQEGQTLLENARAMYDAQIREYGEQYAATQAFREALQQADKTYSAHRRLAKIAFKNDPQRRGDLLLNERKPQVFNSWYEQARHFYTALLADTEAQSQLARYNITADVLQEAQAQVEQTFNLMTIQEQEKGEAQDATQARNEALETLAEWLSDFRVVARIALAENPQLPEALNLGVIPS